MSLVPHASKFIVLMQRSGEFDSKRRAWLVLWELGVIVEMPKGCAIAFPSALILHYNADIITERDEVSGQVPPGLTGSVRGSLVLFTQARLFSMATLGETITEARARGRDADTTFDTSQFTRLGAQDVVVG